MPSIILMQPLYLYQCKLITLYREEKARDQLCYSSYNPSGSAIDQNCLELARKTVFEVCLLRKLHISEDL